MKHLTFTHSDILIYAVMIIAILQGMFLYWNANRKEDNELKRIWDDTLKSPKEKKYSRKSVYMFICFYVGVFMGICLVIYDAEHFGEYIFTTYFLTGTGLNILSYFDKQGKQNTVNENSIDSNLDIN